MYRSISFMLSFVNPCEGFVYDTSLKFTSRSLSCVMNIIFLLFYHKFNGVMLLLVYILRSFLCIK